MADIASTAWGGVKGWFGQQEVPDLVNKSPSELISGIPVGQLAKKQLKYNSMIAAGMPAIYQGVEDAFDPGIAALRAKTTGMVTKDLQDPYSIPLDVQKMIARQAGEGMGDIAGMMAGRSLTAADFGLTSMDLYNNRLNRAMGWVRSSPSWNSLFQPDRSLTPGVGLGLETQYYDNENEQNVYLSQLESANNQALIRGTLTNDIALAGSVMGMMGGMGGSPTAGGANTPNITPSSYGGASQPNFSTLRFAAPAGTTY